MGILLVLGVVFMLGGLLGIVVMACLFSGKIDDTQNGRNE